MNDPYVYKSKVVDVVDGDTLDVVVDVGFNMTRRIRLRLADVDTHETYGVPKDTEEYQRGERETAFVESWIAEVGDAEWPFLVKTEKKGKYGRYIAYVHRTSDGEVLNERLLEQFDGVGVRA